MKHALLAALVMSLPVPGRAEEPVKLEEVVVTATRIPLPPGDNGSATLALDREQIRDSHARDLVELLASLPSVECTRNGSAGATASLRLRGSGDNHVLLLVDGVEQNDPSSPGRSVDLSLISLNDIERVEVVLGPQSALYGADSIGGVVQLLTRRPGDVSLRAGMAAGSHGQQEATLGLSGRLGALGVNLGLSHLQADGESAAAERRGNHETDGFSRRGASLGLDWRMDGGWRLDAALRLSDGKTELDNFGGAAGDDPNHDSEFEDRQLSVGGGKVWGAGLSRVRAWERRLERQYRNDQDSRHPDEAQFSNYDGRVRHVEVVHEAELPGSHRLLAGIEWEQEQAESASTSLSAFGLWEETFDAQVAATSSVFLQDHWSSGRLRITTGIRLDRHEDFDARGSGRLALAWQATDGGVLRGSIGSGTKTPSLYQRFSAYGTPDLAAERSIGWDLGVDLRRDGWSASLGGFDNRILDMIDFNSTTWLYHNINEARIRGIEFSLDVTPDRGPGWGLQAQLQEARDPLSGERLLRRTEQTLGAHLQDDVAGIRLRLDGRYTGPREDLDFSSNPAPRIELGAVFLLDLGLSRQLWRGVEAWAKVDNLLDRSHEDVWGYGAPGRWWRLGLRWEL